MALQRRLVAIVLLSLSIYEVRSDLVADFYSPEWHLVDVPQVVCEKGLGKDTIEIDIDRPSLQAQYSPYVITLFRTSAKPVTISLEVQDATGKQVMPKQVIELSAGHDGVTVPHARRLRASSEHGAPLGNGRRNLVDAPPVAQRSLKTSFTGKFSSWFTGKAGDSMHALSATSKIRGGGRRRTNTRGRIQSGGQVSGASMARVEGRSRAGPVGPPPRTWTRPGSWGTGLAVAYMASKQYSGPYRETPYGYTGTVDIAALPEYGFHDNHRFVHQVMLAYPELGLQHSHGLGLGMGLYGLWSNLHSYNSNESFDSGNECHHEKEGDFWKGPCKECWRKFNRYSCDVAFEPPPTLYADDLMVASFSPAAEDLKTPLKLTFHKVDGEDYQSKAQCTQERDSDVQKLFVTLTEVQRMKSIAGMDSSAGRTVWVIMLTCFGISFCTFTCLLYRTCCVSDEVSSHTRATPETEAECCPLCASPSSGTQQIEMAGNNAPQNAPPGIPPSTPLNVQRARTPAEEFFLQHNSQRSSSGSQEFFKSVGQ
jgi:hypothetical protein